uniref:Uncharacterized protein n=1 Tax=Glossina brevipalpis TaxID=37001 RepID=A0A1A9WHI1_9MUSC
MLSFEYEIRKNRDLVKNLLLMLGKIFSSQNTLSKIEIEKQTFLVQYFRDKFSSNRTKFPKSNDKLNMLINSNGKQKNIPQSVLDLYAPSFYTCSTMFAQQDKTVEECFPQSRINSTWSLSFFPLYRGFDHLKIILRYAHSFPCTALNLHVMSTRSKFEEIVYIKLAYDRILLLILYTLSVVMIFYYARLRSAHHILSQYNNFVELSRNLQLFCLKPNSIEERKREHKSILMSLKM